MDKQRREVLTGLTAAAGWALSPGARGSAAAQAPAEPAQTKEVVSGIGGFFVRAHDPQALEQWYQEHLGITVTPKRQTDPVWTEQGGQTLFSPFAETTKYFGDASKMWMMNFRVRDLDRIAAQLQAAGIAVKVDPTAYPNGRFARLHDPEGNPIELWQPVG